MLSYCLRCRKNTKVKTQSLKRQETEEYCFHQNVLFVVVKNQDLFKSKKLENY